MTEPLLGKELTASLTVNDLAASAAWYENVAGFAVTQKYEREGKLMAVSFSAGDVHILLAQDDGKQGADRVKGAGFSLMITTTQDIDALAAAIRAAGGVLEGDPATMPWEQRMFRIRDLDGFRFTIASPRT